MAQWAAAARSADTAEPHQTASRRLLESLEALSTGAAESAAVFATQAGQAAKEAQAASLRVDAASLLAFAQLEQGDIDGARASARRASRMGRTESVPQSEYLAGLALARVRRHCGQSHYAARILTTLAAVAPDPWKASVALERFLCGEVNEAAAVHRSDATPVAAAVEALLRRETAASPPLWVPLARLLDETWAMIDPRHSASSDDVRRWRRGEAPIPMRYSGLSLTRGSHDQEPVGCPWIWVRPGEPALRLLALGADRLGELPRVRAPRRQRRTSQALAVLVLAPGSSLTREALFERVYGFPFRATAHRGTLDVLVHRVREVFDPVGALERDTDIVLRPRVAFLMEDQPPERPLADVVLKRIAAHPGLGARTLAKDLGVALRTLQELLAALTDEGMCAAVKDGRRLAYHVEDTAFSEPTRGAAIAKS